MCLISPPTSFGWEKTGGVDALVALVDSDDAMTTVPLTGAADTAGVAAGADVVADVDEDEASGCDWPADGD
jgi:hypothetical protein